MAILICGRWWDVLNWMAFALVGYLFRVETGSVLAPIPQFSVTHPTQESRHGCIVLFMVYCTSSLLRCSLFAHESSKDQESHVIPTSHSRRWIYVTLGAFLYRHASV